MSLQSAPGMGLLVTTVYALLQSVLRQILGIFQTFLLSDQSTNLPVFHYFFISEIKQI